jgi:hypothetical protein
VRQGNKLVSIYDLLQYLCHHGYRLSCALHQGHQEVWNTAKMKECVEFLCVVACCAVTGCLHFNIIFTCPICELYQVAHPLLIVMELHTIPYVDAVFG